jgi:phosphate transport system substrate-binding protein
MLPYLAAVSLQDKLDILPINGVMPTAETIADDRYEGVHTLYYYVKRDHMRDGHGNGVVRGLRQFINEATGEAARSPGGYLASLGVVPLPPELRAAARRSALRLERFTR